MCSYAHKISFRSPRLGLDSCLQNHRHNWLKILQAGVSRSIKEIDNVLDGPVSLIIGSFKVTLGPMVGVWLVLKATVSKRTAKTLLKGQKQQSHLHAFAGQRVGTSRAFYFRHTRSF